MWRVLGGAKGVSGLPQGKRAEDVAATLIGNARLKSGRKSKMDNSKQLETARNLALQKIGRNVVNLAKMEGMLKYLLAYGNVSAFAVKGSEQQFVQHLKDRFKKISRMTLGTLIDEASTKLLVEKGRPEYVTTDLLDPKLTISFVVEADKEVLDVIRTDLKLITSERNTLIHETLAAFNPNLLESCERTSAQLDEQRERILQPYSFLESLVIEHRAYLKELATGDFQMIDVAESPQLIVDSMPSA
jgi:hypothetical protein